MNQSPMHHTEQLIMNLREAVNGQQNAIIKEATATPEDLTQDLDLITEVDLADESEAVVDTDETVKIASMPMADIMATPEFREGFTRVWESQVEPMIVDLLFSA